MQKALLYDEVRRIVGKPIYLVRVKNHQLLYDLIDDISTPDLLRVLLHYQNNGDQKTIAGHWCAMIIDKLDKAIHYYDSYGDKVDATLNYIPPSKRIDYEQDDKFIDRFLVHAMRHGYEIHYNDHKHQSNSKGVNTCGRYSACFLKYARSVDDFHNYLSNYSKHNNCESFDDAIVKLTQNYC